jgi:threonine/homoserine/homoserine lactone efflux protein
MTLALPPAELLAPFLLTVAITELTPGPNMGYLALVGTRWGRMSGLMSVAGVTLGLAIYLAAALAGVTRVIIDGPWIFQSLRWLGVGYLIWLAVDSWRGAAQPADEGGAGAAPSRGRLFWRGVLANILNPKAALFYAVLLPGFIDPRVGNPVAQMALLGAIHLAVATGVHMAIVLTASGLRPRDELRRARTDRIAGRVMAVGLVAVAVWLAWEARGA